TSMSNARAMTIMTTTGTPAATTTAREKRARVDCGFAMLDSPSDNPQSAIHNSQSNNPQSSTGKGRNPQSEKPLVSIRAADKSAAVDLKSLWDYRELLYFLTWRDVKAKYKQTAFGAAWAVIQPLFTMIIFSIFFGKFARLPSDGIPYPLFAYAALLPWTFFTT